MSRARGSTVLLVLSLVWLGAMLWSANANITGTGNALGALIQVADALPVVIAASMLAGTAAALAVLARVRPRGRLHWPVALGSGAAVGAVAAGLILVGYGHRSSIMLLALSVVVAGAVGGGLGAVRPAELIAAGIAGTLAAFFVAFALHVFEDQLLQLFGAASSPASQLAAASRLALTTSLLGGAAAIGRPRGQDLRTLYGVRDSTLVLGGERVELCDLLTGRPAAEVTGRGTGPTNEERHANAAFVERALAGT